MDLFYGENRIKRARTLEAEKKNLSGEGGKLFFIAKHLGNPITRHETENYNWEEGKIPTLAAYNFLGDPIENPKGMGYNEDVRYLDNYVEDIGYHYYGISNGNNIEIVVETYSYFEENSTEIKLYFQNDLMYHEIDEDLFAYVPRKDWEEKINDLYKLAKTKLVNKTLIEEDQQNQEVEIKKNNLMKVMNKLWGIFND